MIAKEPGQVRDDNELKMKSVWCPPGFVTMEQVEALEEPATKKDETADDDSIGEPAPEPRKRTAITPVKVFVTKGYWLGKFEVTQSEWKQVMATEPWQGKECTKEGDDFPATCVTWGEAIEFCRKLTELEQKAGRVPGGWEYTLPTEAQWERACRAGTKTNFSFGDEESKLGEYAWFSDNAARAGEEYAHRVGQKKPNPWGLHDMHGDVREWCRDWYGVKLPGGREPEVTKGGALRVIRGGSWSNVARGCRSAERFWYDPSNQYVLLGFRVALSSSGTK
jgi:formylglycine-generating enzyme required for sulfatase activity